ncbi:hypothetical protein [Acidaminobacterium chupaoyuni]
MAWQKAKRERTVLKKIHSLPNDILSGLKMKKGPSKAAAGKRGASLMKRNISVKEKQIGHKKRQKLTMKYGVLQNSTFTDLFLHLADNLLKNKKFQYMI